jgi:hypothetical protein
MRLLVLVHPVPAFLSRTSQPDRLQQLGLLDDCSIAASSIAVVVLHAAHTLHYWIMSSHLEPARGILVRAASFPGAHPDSDSHQSLPGVTPSISFAPLPPPVKRSKSHRRRPLGVAGRSTILQQQNRLRRHHQDQGQHENGYPRSRHQERGTDIDEDDDALLELARLVKDAGKKIWKSLSSRPQPPPGSTTNAAPSPEDDETRTIQHLPDPQPNSEPVPADHRSPTPVDKDNDPPIPESAQRHSLDIQQSQPSEHTTTT